MEVSSFSTTSRGYWCSSSTELLLLKRVRLPIWYQCSMSNSSIRRAAQPLLGRSGSLIKKENSVKVLCSQKRGIPVLEARYVVGLAGPPGAGKSTIASEVVRRVNKLWPQKASSFNSQVAPPDVATVLPMDGFHLYRYQLNAMENPEEAHARRGAPWTFDPALLLTCLKTLRSQGSVYAPSFDHGVGDPVEDDIFVSLQHKVVIVEGNYLLLEEGVWKEISSMFDEKWFIEVDIDTAMQRVLKRHISTGKPPDTAKWRIEYNDQPNAELIIKSKKNADLIIRSIDF